MSGVKSSCGGGGGGGCQGHGGGSGGGISQGHGGGSGKDPCVQVDPCQTASVQTRGTVDPCQGNQPGIIGVGCSCGCGAAINCGRGGQINLGIGGTKK